MGTDWQFSYDVATWGAGTDTDIASIEGLGMPDMRSSDVDRPNNHGEYYGTDFLNGRTVTFEINVKAASMADMQIAMALIEQAMAPKTDAQNLQFQIPGQGTRIIKCRPRKKTWTANDDYHRAYASVHLNFHAADPRQYDATEQNVYCSPGSGAALGMTFDATFGLSFGGSISPSQVTVTNDGTFQTPWTARIDGPITDPKIYNDTTGQYLDMTGTIPDGQYLLIDSDAHTVLLNGTASRYSWLSSTSQWWNCEPGDTVFRFTSGSVATGTLTVYWRSAWLG